MMMCEMKKGVLCRVYKQSKIYLPLSSLELFPLDWIHMFAPPIESSNWNIRAVLFQGSLKPLPLSFLFLSDLAVAAARECFRKCLNVPHLPRSDTKSLSTDVLAGSKDNDKNTDNDIFIASQLESKTCPPSPSRLPFDHYYALKRNGIVGVLAGLYIPGQFSGLEWPSRLTELAKSNAANIEVVRGIYKLRSNSKRS